MSVKTPQEQELTALKRITKDKVKDLRDFIELRVEKARTCLESSNEKDFKNQQGRLQELRDQLKLIDFILKK
tara:strand:+ start:2713 stop:2928 length:216 start_codon:yes stop_codon:yes gene_type:complete